MSSPNRENREPRFIIVVGASAGGLNALTELVAQLDPSIDASLFVVMHLSRTGISDFLMHQVKKYTALKTIVPIRGMKIERGTIYIAPPNFHLIIRDGEVALGHGPEENRWRPSIDVLFRSAAATYDGRVIGVILTGLLDDGTAGMIAIKRSGGRTVVQDPNKAEYPDMPLSVLNAMEVDECLPLCEIGSVLNHMAQQNDITMVPIPEDIKAEAEISEKVVIGIDAVSSLGEQTVFTCPDCGGGLWKIVNGGFEHYRCHIGHSYSEADLNLEQADAVEGTLWVAVRMMEERRKLLKQMEESTANKGFNRLAMEHKIRREELDSHIDRLRNLLFAVQRTD